MKKKILGAFMVSTMIVMAIMKIDFDKNSTTGFVLANLEALAYNDPETAKPILWFRKNSDCVTTLKGKANTSFSITIGGQSISGSYNKDGEYEYRVKDGQTDCEIGGGHQCEAKYCN